MPLMCNMLTYSHSRTSYHNPLTQRVAAKHKSNKQCFGASFLILDGNQLSPEETLGQTTRAGLLTLKQCGWPDVSQQWLSPRPAALLRDDLWFHAKHHSMKSSISRVSKAAEESHWPWRSVQLNSCSCWTLRGHGKKTGCKGEENVFNQPQQTLTDNMTIRIFFCKWTHLL